MGAKAIIATGGVVVRRVIIAYVAAIEVSIAVNRSSAVYVAAFVVIAGVAIAHTAIIEGCRSSEDTKAVDAAALVVVEWRGITDSAVVGESCAAPDAGTVLSAGRIVVASIVIAYTTIIDGSDPFKEELTVVGTRGEGCGPTDACATRIEVGLSVGGACAIGRTRCDAGLPSRACIAAVNRCGAS